MPVGQIVKMLHQQKAIRKDTSMSLVVLRQTVPLSVPLPVMIVKTGFQICHGKLKHDPPTHYNR